jgi:uncharacterized membrane protein YhfC
MSPGFQLGAGRFAAMAAAIVFEVALPLVLALVARRRLGVGWRYFGYGALIFLLFQLVTRVPIILAIQAAIAPQLQASRALLVTWLAVAALTAGVFEEVGRYVGYRWLMKGEEKTWPKAIMYGLGHGGLESMLFVGGLTLLTLINLLLLPAVIGTLPDEQRSLVEQQLAAVAAQPEWLPLLGTWERLWTIPVHVALSAIVLQVFRRHSIRWLALAVLVHTLVNLVVVGTPTLLGMTGMSALLLPEALVTICGLAALWVIWALRDLPEEVAVPVEGHRPAGPALAAEADLPGDGGTEL